MNECSDIVFRQSIDSPWDFFGSQKKKKKNNGVRRDSQEGRHSCSGRRCARCHRHGLAGTVPRGLFGRNTWVLGVEVAMHGSSFPSMKLSLLTRFKSFVRLVFSSPFPPPSTLLLCARMHRCLLPRPAAGCFVDVAPDSHELPGKCQQRQAGVCCVEQACVEWVGMKGTQ